MRLPRFRLRTLMIAVAVAGVMLTVLKVANWTVNHHRWEFQRDVPVGSTPARVLAVAGSPKETIAPGGVLRGGWGGLPARTMPVETWVYYIGPLRNDRMAVLFSKGKVIQVIHDPG